MNNKRGITQCSLIHYDFRLGILQRVSSLKIIAQVQNAWEIAILRTNSLVNAYNGDANW
jgi:hypothetical protein